MKCRLCNGKLSRYSYVCKSCGATYRVPEKTVKVVLGLIAEILMNLSMPFIVVFSLIYREPLLLLLFIIPFFSFLLSPKPKELELELDKINNRILKKRYDRKITHISIIKEHTETTK